MPVKSQEIKNITETINTLLGIKITPLVRDTSEINREK